MILVIINFVRNRVTGTAGPVTTGVATLNYESGCAARGNSRISRFTPAFFRPSVCLLPHRPVSPNDIATGSNSGQVRSRLFAARFRLFFFERVDFVSNLFDVFGPRSC